MEDLGFGPWWTEARGLDDAVDVIAVDLHGPVGLEPAPLQNIN